MALIVKTIGSAGGRDYSTIVAWVAALPANLVTDGNSYEGDCYNDAIFDDGQILIGGHTTDATHTITLTTGAGQSFRDKSNAQSNALNYNQANGVALTRSVGGSSTVIVSDDFVTLSGLQIRHTAGASGGALRGSAGVANQHFIMTNCILNSDTTNASICTFDDGTILINCLFVRLAQGTSAGVVANEGSVNQTINAYFCDFVAPSDISAPASALLIQAAGSTFVTENCAFFGCTAVNGASGGTYTHTTGMSDVASPPTGVTGSKTYGNQFQNTTTASGDYRLKPGADLRGAATADATNGATDILATQRPQLMRWDIGAMEFPQPYMDAEFPGLAKRRRPWRAGAEPSEFVFNPTQVAFAKWGFDEPRQREPQPTRRKAWRAGAQSLGDEFLRNPTQTAFVNWSFDEPRQREPQPTRRRVHLNQTSPDEFILNPTQVAFTNWSFDEPRQREPQPVRRRAWRAGAELSDTGNIGPVQLVGVPWAFDEPIQREIGPIRRRAWRASAQSLSDEFLFNPTQAVFILWGGIDEEAHRLKYRIAWRAAAQSLSDEFLLNPTQVAFANWGYDEPQYQQVVRRRRWFQLPEDVVSIGAVPLVGRPWFDDQVQRAVRRLPHAIVDKGDDGLLYLPIERVIWTEPDGRRSTLSRLWHRTPAQDDHIGLIQLVGVPWGQDEPPFQRIVRRSWRSFPRQEAIDDIGAVQLVGAPWFDEQPATLRRRRAILRSQLDVEGLPFTASERLAWADIEERSSPRRPRRLSLARSEEDIGLVQLVAVPWGFDEPPFQRVVRSRWFSREQPDNADIGAIQLVGVPWGFDEPDRTRSVSRLRTTHSTSDEAVLPSTTIVTDIHWFEDHPTHVPRRARWIVPVQQPDTTLSVAIVTTPLVLTDHEFRRVQFAVRSMWRAHVSEEEAFNLAVPIPPGTGHIRNNPFIASIGRFMGRGGRS